MKKTNKIRYAVVGLGHIAQSAVLPGFKNASNSTLAALVSGNPKKLKELGKRYKVKNLYSYDQYDECLNSDEIDAVYITLPNNQHREYSERAMQAGIHVLCEKPMAVSSDACESMIRTAKENRVKLMVAYRLHFEESHLDAIRLLKANKFGDVRVINSTFTVPIKHPGIRTSLRQEGGGPLYDIGIYCINAARYLFRSEPEEVLAMAARSDKDVFKNIDESVAVQMKFPGEGLASFVCSFGCAHVGNIQVAGTKGDLFIENAYQYYGPKFLHATIRDKTKIKKVKSTDQFGPELLYFSNCIIKDIEPESSGKEGLADIRIIESIYRSLDTRQPVRVESTLERPERPEPGQEISLPEVKKPELIEVEKPTGKEAA